jgi:hypothetical protein
LAHALSVVLKDYLKAADECYERYETAHEMRWADFYRQDKELEKAINEVKEGRKDKDNLRRFLGKLQGAIRPDLFEAASDVYHKEMAAHRKSVAEIHAMKSRMSESRKEKEREVLQYYEDYQRKLALAHERAEMLKRSAEAAGLELNM